MLLLFGGPSRGVETPQATTSRVMLMEARGGEARTREAEARLRDELRAAGHEVVSTPASAEVAIPREEEVLRAATAMDADLAVFVASRREELEATIWWSRAVGSSPESRSTVLIASEPSLLALEVAEAVHRRLVKVTPRRSEAAVVRSEGPPRPPGALVGGGVTTLGAFGIGAFVGPSLFLHLPLGARIGIDLDAQGLALTRRLQSHAASATVGLGRSSVGISLRLGRHPRMAATLGLAGTVIVLGGTGRAALPATGHARAVWAGGASARLRVAFLLRSRLALTTDAAVSAVFPRVRLRLADATVGTFASPLAELSIGLAFAWPGP